MDSTNSLLRIEVYLRAFTPEVASRQQETLLERVKACHESGAIDELEVTYWNRKVCLDWTSGTKKPVGALVYRELQQAVAGTELSIDPFFRERARPDNKTVVSLPVVCVVLRRGRDVVGIYPCSSEDGCHSVSDCLDAVENDESVANLREDVELNSAPV